MDTRESSAESTDLPSDDTRIVFVDDEPTVVETYAMMLRSEYTVLTATSGSEALDRIDEAVDVVFLDRRMPEMSGDEVLAELRQRGYEMPVAMLTAVEPADDIVEMPFDDYLTKPVDGDKLSKKVEILSNRSEFDTASRELYSLASKKAALEADGINAEERETYQEICQRMQTLRNKVDETLDDLMGDDPEAAFRDL